KARQRVRQRRDVLRTGRQREWIIDERRATFDRADRSFGYAAKLDDPLGDQVDVSLDGFVDFVEQLMESDERRALHIPMRLLALRLQVDALGEALVEERYHLDACRFRQIVLRRKQPRWFALAARRQGLLFGHA